MKESVWSPFQAPVYRAFWLCAFMSNLGTWVQDVAASWVMTHLSSSPLVISLLSFCTSMPVLFLSVAAGYVADLGYRRQLLVGAQVGMFLSAAALAYLVWSDQVTEGALLGLSLLMGVGFALTNPALQSVLTDLVPSARQAQAVLAYYMGLNITRVLGPAMGGGVLSFWGPSSAFLINSLSFLGLILFFWRWPIAVEHSTRKPLSWSEKEWSRWISLENMKLWVEIFAVAFCASSLWALYPVRGRIDLALNSWQYGSLLGCFGLGACVSALLSNRIMQPEKTQTALAGAYLVFAGGILVLGISQHYAGLCLAMFLGGTGWLVLSTLMNVSSRQATGSSPFKATMLGVFLAVFYAGMALGAVSWGALARMSTSSISLFVAALFLGLIGFVKGLRHFGGLH